MASAEVANPVADRPSPGDPEPEPDGTSGPAKKYPGADEERDSADELVELVELPDEFGRIGAWLSTPKGRPTPLAYVAYAVSVGYPL